MTTEEAIRILSDMYSQAPYGETALQVHLFGIKYADQLKGLDLHHIAERATGYRTYGTEINKGRNLAKYVKLKDE